MPRVCAVDSIEARPAALTAFIAGWFDTIAWMRANKQKTIAVAAETMGTDVELAGAIYDELMPMFSNDGHFHAKALDTLAESFVELKVLPAKPDMTTLYTEALLPK